MLRRTRPGSAQNCCGGCCPREAKSVRCFPFDTTPLRARPLLQRPDELWVLPDCEFLDDKLWLAMFDLIGHGKPAAAVLGQFGKAVEKYVYRLQQSMASRLPGRRKIKLLSNPREAGGREITDVALRDGDALVLFALRDDAYAGFDGYQKSEGNEPDEDAVDAQVRSVRYALEYDFPLGYINPPPSFTELSQRLRTPSDVLGGGRGTCIDLALLMASCLEYMDIKAAIFLLEGHAFAAYWSTEEARKDFLAVRMDAPREELPDNATPLPDPEQVEQIEQERSFAQNVSWEFDESRYEEVFRAVQSGDLVPLETTMLTNRGGFWDAIDEGINNLRDPEDFYCMLDIQLARDHGVTPLPLVPEGQGLRGHRG